jgi:hypothetical protein
MLYHLFTRSVCTLFQLVRQNMVFGVATCYWLDGPGIGSRLIRDFPHPSGPTLCPTHPSCNGTGSLLRVDSGQEVALSAQHNLASRKIKGTPRTSYRLRVILSYCRMTLIFVWIMPSQLSWVPSYTNRETVEIVDESTHFARQAMYVQSDV